MTLTFQDKMWIMGGWYNGRLPGHSASNEVWWSTDGEKWEQATVAAGWTPRIAAAVVEFKGRMWLLGGTENYYFGDDSSLKNDVWSSADGTSWELVTAEAGWAPRAYHQAAVLIVNRVSAFTADGPRLADLVQRAGKMPFDLLNQIRTNKHLDFSQQVEASIDAWLNPAGLRGFLRPTASLVLGSPGYFEMFRHSDRPSRMVLLPLMQLTAGVEYLRREPGEKRIVMMALHGVSAPYRIIGIPNIDDENEEQILARQLTDAEIALDLVHTYGNGTTHSQRIRNARGRTV